MAEEAARKSGAKSAHMNQSLKKILGQGPLQRPDVTVVNKNGTVDMVEIPSKGQTRAQMENKLTNMRESINRPGANIVQNPDPVGRTVLPPRIAPRPTINGVFIPLIIIQVIVHEIANDRERQRALREAGMCMTDDGPVYCA